MKTNIIPLFFFVALLFSCSHIYSQKKKLQGFDSALEANSEEWKVNMHTFTGKRMGKLEFGPYTTLGIEKVEKEEDYRMLLATTTDTAKLLFSVSRFWHGKKSTFADRLLSSNFALFGREGDLTLAYGFKISGLVATENDSIPSRFFMEDSISEFEVRFSHWHLVTVNDSLYTEPFMMKFGKTGSIFYNWWTGVYVNNTAGVHIAALKFEESNPYIVWISKDIDSTQQHMIASLFSLMMVVRSNAFP